MIPWLSLALNYLGLVAFAAALESHRHTFSRAAVRRRPGLLRVGGGALQAAALALAFAAGGSGGGWVLWIAGWAPCGFALTLVLAFRPRWWPAPAFVALALAAVAPP